jgi:hypothetical protein
MCDIVFCFYLIPECQRYSKKSGSENADTLARALNIFVFAFSLWKKANTKARCTSRHIDKRNRRCHGGLLFLPLKLDLQLDEKVAKNQGR